VVLRVLPITPAIAGKVAQLDSLGFHKDPADQLIVATRWLHRLRLTSNDTLIGSGVGCRDFGGVRMGKDRVVAGPKNGFPLFQILNVALRPHRAVAAPALLCRRHARLNDSTMDFRVLSSVRPTPSSVPRPIF
jgi:hypothetical protein